MLTQVVGTIFCIGRNYVEHAKELGNPVPSSPVVFVKPRGAFVPEPKTLLYPKGIARLDPEVELVVQVGQDADSVTESQALELVTGYAVGLDVTSREEQTLAKQKGLPWLLSKGRKGFAPVSHFLSPAQTGHGPFQLSLWVNGELRQRGSTAEMLFSVPKLLVFLAKEFGLRQGDIVFTGTPAGVGPVHSGETLKAQVLAGRHVATLEIHWA